MKKLLFLFSFLFCLSVYGQQGTFNYVRSYYGLVVGSQTQNQSAIVDVQGTNGGFLCPRLTTTQRNAIVSPAEGLMVYNTSTSAFNYYNGSSWIAVGTGGGSVTSVAMTVPSFLSVAGSPVTTSGTLAVSLSGTALPVANGGTGLTSYAIGDIIYASGATILSKLPIGTASQQLRVNAGATALEYFTSVNTSWGLTGNAGTDPNVNYIGTSDGAPLYVTSGGDANNNVLSYILLSKSFNSTDSIGFLGLNMVDSINNAQGYLGMDYDQMTITQSNYNSDTSNSITLTKDSIYISDASGLLYTLPTTSPTAGQVLTAVTNNKQLSWQNTYADNISLTGQTTTISATNIANTDTVGLYEINFYMVVTTADVGAGDVTVSFMWNDGTAARTVTSNALPLTSTGYINHITGILSGNMIVNDGSGSVQYATTVNTIGTADYALYVNVTKLN